MPFSSVTEAELDMGIDFAFKSYGCTLNKTTLRELADKLMRLRHINNKPFPEALRTVLNERGLKDDRRVWFRATLGKIFSSRSARMHKGKVPKRRNPTIPRSGTPRIPTIMEGNQFAFLFQSK